MRSLKKAFLKNILYFIFIFVTFKHVVEKYQKLENEKKTTRTVRKTHVGPMIRYQSLSMPIMVLSETYVEEKDETIDVECDENKIDKAFNNTNSDVSLKEKRYIFLCYKI